MKLVHCTASCHGSLQSRAIVKAGELGKVKRTERNHEAQRIIIRHPKAPTEAAHKNSRWGCHRCCNKVSSMSYLSAYLDYGKKVSLHDPVPVNILSQVSLKSSTTLQQARNPDRAIKQLATQGIFTAASSRVYCHCSIDLNCLPFDSRTEMMTVFSGSMNPTEGITR